MEEDLEEKENKIITLEKYLIEKEDKINALSQDLIKGENAVWVRVPLFRVIFLINFFLVVVL